MCLFGNVGHFGFVTAGYERGLIFLRILSEDELTDSEHTKRVPSTSVFLKKEVMQRSVVRLIGVTSALTRGFRSTASVTMPIKVKSIKLFLI